jgi:hypothetical protein
MDSLSSELAVKAHIDAVSRDYICEPHIGARAAAAARGDRAPLPSIAGPPGALITPLSGPRSPLQSTGPSAASAAPWWWWSASR